MGGAHIPGKVKEGFMSKTSDLTNDIVAALSERGHLLCRNNSGVARFPGRVVRFGVGPVGGGGGDLIGLTAWGQFISLEVKVGRDKQSDKQAKWQAWVRRRSGIAGVVRSVDDAIDLIETYGNK